MVTRIRFAAIVAVLWAAGCGSTARDSQPSPDPGDNPPQPPNAVQYPGYGFVVHEWGTDTIVVGSDGSMQRGLHHEEEDLPAFVYDRMSAGTLPGSTSINVDVKMETPVTYFYSDEPRTVDVAVDFPKGVFTQWYPAVKSFYPLIMGANVGANHPEPADPVLDPTFPFSSQTCIDKYGFIGNGLLQWGTVDVLPRGERPALPEAPLDRFSWSFARDVDANDLRVQGVPGAEAPQSERFLFYRGLGNFDLPAKVTAAPGGHLTVENTFADPVRGVFVLNVGADKAAFRYLPAGVPAGGSIETEAPALEGGAPIDAYIESLGAEVTKALDATGLYHDEAVAMVNTWKRQWFATPGLRLLYLAPQSWTDASIPLSVEPKPDATVRVMVIRVEVITPELEELDTVAAEKLGGVDAGEGEAHFLSLGRFAEPRLRRATSLIGETPASLAFLSAITTADTRVAAGE